MTRRPSAIFAALALIGMLGQAQAQNLGGQWSCNDVRRYIGSLAENSEHRVFQMLVFPNGTVQGGGTANFVNGAVFRYTFNGPWWMDGNTFHFNVRSSIGNGAQMDFESIVLDQSNMAQDWIDQATGTRRATNCQRMG